MNCVITGDIIGSRKVKDSWLQDLKAALKYVVGQGGKWEIYRGDSFQLTVNAADALQAAIYIKATIKVNKPADVRMGIGFGDVKSSRKKLSESSGDVFIYSGAAFDGLKQEKVNLAIKTAFADFDEDINIMLKLALIAMDGWGVVSAEIVKLALTHQQVLQSELAALSGKTQSSVSEALKRAHYAEIMEMDKIFRKKLDALNQP